MEKIKANLTQVLLKNVLKVKDPVFRQISETCNLRVFFGFIFVACWIIQWVNSDREIEQFFAGFFHISH